MITPKKPRINSVKDFRDYIQKSKFDSKSVKPWEKETLRHYLRKTK